MKLGAEKKGQVIAVVVLFAVAGFMLWRTLAPGDSASPSAAQPASAATGAAVPLPLTHLDPTLHMDKLDRLRAIEYTGSGRDLFRMGAAPALAQNAAPAGRGGRGAQLAAAEAARAAAPSGPPPPPPIPLKFFGFASSVGEPEKIFLQMGDDSYVVKEGDTIEHRYLIESIGKASVRVKDLQTQSEQELPLQQS